MWIHVDKFFACERECLCAHDRHRMFFSLKRYYPENPGGNSSCTQEIPCQIEPDMRRPRLIGNGVRRGGGFHRHQQPFVAALVVVGEEDLELGDKTSVRNASVTRGLPASIAVPSNAVVFFQLKEKGAWCRICIMCVAFMCFQIELLHDLPTESDRHILRSTLAQNNPTQSTVGPELDQFGAPPHISKVDKYSVLSIGYSKGLHYIYIY